ncbi:MAG: alpha-ketoacid dehydrogenase subunit beta [Candidatus Brocadiae bacterium]|nr:alpha-ketoacid dehydrogenase subunit beta [Candidatus Brocadiia bacterium]
MATLTLLQAVNDGLRTEMRRDDRVVCLGEDIGINGGVFRATEGLQKEFGAERVIDTPLAESGIIGTAIGMALYGLKPVPEIQFMDFIYPAFDQIVSELAKFRYRSGGQFPSPVVIRTPYGGGIKGGHYHSQSAEAYFCHTPGIQVVIPSTPHDAKGLLASAIRGEDPVLFMEPKRIYRSIKGEVPEGEYTVPIGKAAIARPGTQVTIVAWGSMTHIALEAAEKAQEEKGVSCEVLDLRSLVPLDKAALLESVKKTGRVVIVCEAPRTGGYAGELSAIIAEEAIDSMEAPIVRVTGFDTPFPYTLEHAYMPNTGRILKAIDTVVNF